MTQTSDHAQIIRVKLLLFSFFFIWLFFCVCVCVCLVFRKVVSILFSIWFIYYCFLGTLWIFFFFFFQCSSCKEYFLGHPINGHQCYRHMTMEQDYCFNPVTQNRCNQETLPLHQGRTVFFSVQPKYLNVNIRITVDVTEGGKLQWWHLRKQNPAFVDWVIMKEVDPPAQTWLGSRLRRGSCSFLTWHLRVKGIGQGLVYSYQYKGKGGTSDLQSLSEAALDLRFEEICLSTRRDIRCTLMSPSLPYTCGILEELMNEWLGFKVFDDRTWF